jgi:hypothetical protein
MLLRPCVGLLGDTGEAHRLDLNEYADRFYSTALSSPLSFLPMQHHLTGSCAASTSQHQHASEQHAGQQQQQQQKGSKLAITTQTVFWALPVAPSMDCAVKQQRQQCLCHRLQRQQQQQQQQDAGSAHGVQQQAMQMQAAATLGECS